MLFLGGTASILIDRSQEGARLSAGAFFFNGIALLMLPAGFSTAWLIKGIH